MILAFFMGTGT
jgi:transmembrane 9 superfamily protein 2/4